MFEILLIILFFIVFIKTAGMALKISWCIAKAIACVLFVLALPAMALCLLFAGGMILLLPIALIVVAFGILKAA